MNKDRSNAVPSNVRAEITSMGLLFGMILTMVSGCGTRSRLIRAENEVYVDGLVSIWATWVKDKGDKFDLGLSIENLADFPILVRRRDLLCSRGDRWGEATVVRGAGRRIRLKPMQRRQLVLVCRLARDGIRGDYRVVLAHVFEDPGRQSEGPYQLLATDVEWFIADDL